MGSGFKKIKDFFNIRNKLVALFLVVSLLPVIFTYFTLSLTQRSISRQILASYSAIGDTIIKLIDQYVVDCQRVIIDASFQPSIIEGMRTWNHAALSGRFSGIYRKYKNFTFILAEDTRGMVKDVYPYNSHLIGKKFSERANISAKQPGISDVFWSDFLGDVAIVATLSPVKDDRAKPLGTLVGGIDLKKLSEMLRKVKPGKNSYVYLVDRKGVVLLHPDERMLLKDMSREAVVADVVQGKSGVRLVKGGKGPEMIAVYQPTPLTGWGVILQEPARETFAIVIRMKRLIMGITSVILIAAVFFSLHFSRKEITDPIRELQHGAEMIGAGNLSYRLSIKTNDEIEKLAEEFNRMAEKLKGSYESMGEKISVATRDLKDAHKEIEEKNVQLKESDRLKSEFLANMSHELRTPMNAIIGFASLMEERIYGDISEKQEEALKKISRNAKSLLQLINDILDLSKIEAGKLTLIPEKFKLAPLIDEILLTLEPLLKGKSFGIEKGIAADIPELYLDRNRLKQVLVNILSNSIKFTNEGKIEIKAAYEAEGKKVEISVIDTGIGIKEKDLPYIFDEFRQADGSSTREYSGTGLGLSITKKLTALLGGEVKAESVYGEGTGMTVTLPVAMKTG